MWIAHCRQHNHVGKPPEPMSLNDTRRPTKELPCNKENICFIGSVQQCCQHDGCAANTCSCWDLHTFSNPKSVLDLCKSLVSGCKRTVFYVQSRNDHKRWLFSDEPRAPTDHHKGHKLGRAFVSVLGLGLQSNEFRRLPAKRSHLYKRPFSRHKSLWVAVMWPCARVIARLPAGGVRRTFFIQNGVFPLEQSVLSPVFPSLRETEPMTSNVPVDITWRLAHLKRQWRLIW